VNADLAAPLQTAPGWLGKIACLGDFASRRLPLPAAQACDAWLARSIDASRTQLGDRWLETYLTSPLWRFAWAPGVLDAQWWFGVLMPSVDNVGRYFPLLVAQARAQPLHDAPALQQLERWYAQVAGATLATLQPAGTVEHFEEALAQVPALPEGTPAPDVIDTQWPDRTCHEFAVGANLADGMLGHARAATLERLRGCSLWSAWRPGPDGGEAAVSIAVGLPAPASFTQLLRGVW
jgi:type VI secretion system protein ImpM